MAKKLSQTGLVTSVADTNSVMVEVGDSVKRIKLNDLVDKIKGDILGDLNLNSMNDGVFIMFHRNSDNYPFMVKPDKWAGYQTSGEIAEGVVVVEGGRMVVVAPTEAATTLPWSSAAVAGGGTTTSDRLVAFEDWDGKENTASQITHSECSGEDYAPGFCAAYAKTNTAGSGLTAGKWWLPSVAEMMLIYANMRKINYALSLIQNATQLTATAYWTSSEASSTNAWFVYLSYGTVNNYGPKATAQFRVRAVSAFLN